MVTGTRSSSSFPSCGRVGVAACNIELVLATDGGAFRVLPAGLFRGKDGRPRGIPGWRLDEAIAGRVIGRVAQRQDDLVIDYEHQTLYAEKNGQPAPAAGWMGPQSLEWRDDGIYTTDTRWTERARLLIAAGEYRYFSPVFTYDRRTGEVLDLLMGAITNYAALDGLADFAARVAARFSLTQEDSIVDEETLKALGLDKDASEEAINAAIAALRARVETAESELEAERSRAARAEEALAAAKADTGGDPDPARFVPIEVVQSLQTEVAALSARINGSEVDAIVDEAIEAGKLLPAQEAWARDLGNKDLAALRAYVETAQPIAALTGTQTGGQPPSGGDGELTADELAICKAMGVDPEAYKKERVA